MCVCVRGGVRTAWLKLAQNRGLGEAFSRLLQSGCREGVVWSMHKDTQTLGGQSSPEGPAELLEAGAAQLSAAVCSLPRWLWEADAGHDSVHNLWHTWK